MFSWVVIFKRRRHLQVPFIARSGWHQLAHFQLPKSLMAPCMQLSSPGQISTSEAD